MRNSLITVMFLMIIFWGFNSNVGARQTTKTKGARVHLWETRNHKNALWETTSSLAALDIEVKSGARMKL